LLDRSGDRARSTGAGDAHTHIIPARAWLQPTAARYLPEARARLGEAVRRAVWR
jgi:hypothetical protein